MTTPAKVTWFEITSNDPTASRTFYETLFGWNAQGDPDVYLMFPPAGDGGIFTIYRFAQPSPPTE